MNREFVTYEQALALKELGFDEPCFGNWQDMKEINPWLSNSYTISQNQYYGQLCSAPTYSQAFRWFREKYDLHGCIDLHCSTPIHWFIRIDKIDINDYLYHSEDDNIQYSTYEEAELACLDKLLQIVKAAGVQE